MMVMKTEMSIFYNNKIKVNEELNVGYLKLYFPA